MGATGGIAASVSAESDTPWARVCTKFKQEFGQQAYTTWLGQLGYHGLDGGTVELTAPTKFVRDWIQRNYGPRLMDFFHAEDNRVKSLSIRLAAKGAVPATPAQPVVRADSAPQIDASTKDDEKAALDPKYTFDTFVVGKSNELAYAAAKRIAESDEVSFNPLFLHGGVGLGKTHLMHAIAWEVKRRAPQKKVAYVSAEKFMFEFISAIRYKDTHAFKQKFRAADLLMVDDVQFIANKESTQEEFFHTFNALIDNRCQLVITADRSPTDLEGIEERIVSRLGWGLVADIHPTDYELRLGILQSKAEQVPGVDVPVEVLEFLAKRIISNVRELEGALNRVMAYATLVGRPITMEMTRDVLQDLIRANDRKVTIDEIQRTVAEYYNLRLSEMLSQRRSRVIARPRQVAMFLSKQLTSRSLPEIGRRFGGRDHTTVMHAVRKIEDLVKSDSTLDEDITRLTRLLAG
ncbi:MAG: chromosomal replication initiator protein DnaA [Kordiimonadaceae bacterium]|nr:chromosomal replication initiator protein DnaA [Kordiimonadaceae bacterium]MBO6568751.1 chromosomal replication initiator protein DnaA [Kordiimonadaceae bacterium]MBO6965273.1 chromosomal replication initiator protein DnaA [Kordiimonadaceae bacterium]